MGVLKRMLGMTTQSQLAMALASVLSFFGGIAVDRGVISKTDLVYVLGAIPMVCAVIYAWLKASQDEEAARSAANAPALTMAKIIDAAPQVAMDKVVEMDGVKAIVAEDRYARASPNPNVISAQEARNTL